MATLWQMASATLDQRRRRVEYTFSFETLLIHLVAVYGQPVDVAPLVTN
jgi:hypothetical protein